MVFNKRLEIKQYQNGFAEVNSFIEKERLVRLKSLVLSDAIQTYLDLYRTWEQTGKVAGGAFDSIARRRIEDHVRLREAFADLAKAYNYHTK